jgi:triosephosphate isomerase
LFAFCDLEGINSRARKILAAGNWKMNETPSETKALIAEMVKTCASDTVDVLLCVPAIDIPAAVEAAKGSNIQIGAENMYFEESGAFTGEISPAMLVDAGVKYVIIGHSERRQYFAETDQTVNKKVLKALEHGLVPVMCCGETLEQREQGVTMDWIRQQVKIGLNGVTPEDAKKVIIAYEPIWAIGTGKTATSDQAEEVCKGIRDLLRELYGDDVAETTRVLYGGSVKPANAAELFAKEDIDGGLVGGASLKASFGDIVNYAK